ncbi:13844_t:CDS:2 [Ambispora leptoticha]|uniref:13844_t:CDS:1 n=1 Tax=Ambispora leptoticha TaxID=144679 RepID=A0A9N8V8L3_9GLOM|nr:13844_t:CDS:2 [Ambispora leptoticha]
MAQQKRLYLEFVNEFTDRDFTFVFTQNFAFAFTPSNHDPVMANKIKPVAWHQAVIKSKNKAWFEFRGQNGITFGEYVKDSSSQTIYKPRQLLSTEDGLTWNIISREDYLTLFDTNPTTAPIGQIIVKNNANDSYVVGLSLDGAPTSVTHDPVKHGEQVEFGTLTYIAHLVSGPISDGQTLDESANENDYNLAVVTASPGPPTGSNTPAVPKLTVDYYKIDGIKSGFLKSSKL